MRVFNLSDVCFFDCETTGVPAKGLKWDEHFNQFPHVVQLAWAFGEKERSFIVKPDGWIIPDEVVEIHGITTERAIAEGVPFDVIVDEFLADAADAPITSCMAVMSASSDVTTRAMRSALTRRSRPRQRWML